MPKMTPLTIFRINTYKSVSKQRTLSIFRINTYEKQGRGSSVIVNQESFWSAGARSRFAVIHRLPDCSHSLKSRLGRSRRRTDRRAGSLLEGMNRIDRQVVKAFDQTTWPAHLYPVDLAGRPEAEVNTHIAIRDVAG